MGSKGTESAPPTIQGADNSMAMMEMMMAMMGAMGGAEEPAMPHTPSVPETPEVAEVDDIDWQVKHDELAARMAINYGMDLDNQQGAEDTVHTSPLLDEEETTEQSIIAGTIPDANLPIT